MNLLLASTTNSLPLVTPSFFPAWPSRLSFHTKRLIESKRMQEICPPLCHPLETPTGFFRLPGSPPSRLRFPFGRPGVLYGSAVDVVFFGADNPLFAIFPAGFKSSSRESYLELTFRGELTPLLHLRDNFCEASPFCLSPGLVIPPRRRSDSPPPHMRYVCLLRFSSIRV